MATEVFEYADVKRVMNEEVNENKNAARAALRAGSEALRASVGRNINPESAEVGLSGAAGANIEAKWTQLEAEFDAFVREIDKRIENANMVSNLNRGFESQQAQSIGGSGN